MNSLQHHIQCREGDVAPSVLLPGDPARARIIADHFDEKYEIAENREYVTYTGKTGGVPVSVTSTGIGCPSLAIAVEELVRIGADTLIRVGTGGALQQDALPGNLVIATAAIRAEGTSHEYLPPEFPAVSDPEVFRALSEAAAASGRTTHHGVVHSKDSFYGQKEPERMPMGAEIARRYDMWTAGGALLSEMEAATLFIVASVCRVRAGCICAVASNKWSQSRWSESEQRRGVDEMIECTLAAVRSLHAERNNK